MLLFLLTRSPTPGSVELGRKQSYFIIYQLSKFLIIVKVRYTKLKGTNLLYLNSEVNCRNIAVCQICM